MSQRLVRAIRASPNQRIHATGTGSTVSPGWLHSTTESGLLGLHHFREVREFFDQRVPTKSSLNDDGGSACSGAPILALQQLDLLVQQILRQFVTVNGRTKENENKCGAEKERKNEFEIKIAYV